jgi:hypothetical protein
VIKNAEEGVMLLFGENMALGLMVKALIATHHDPKRLREMAEELQSQAAAAIKQMPPPNLHLFRYEQLLEQFLAEIKA